MTSEFGIAVHAMVFLHHKGDMVSSEVLAENICTNPARVRKVMAQLKRAGLVETHEGAVGGYRFAGSADTVTLCDIAQAVGAAFVSASWRSGDVDKPCLVASGMGALMDEVYTGLDALCKERLQSVTVAALEARLFDGKPFVLTGNYPYNISSQIFFKMLDNKDIIPCCTGMIQKEVAERIAAGPGSKTYGILSVLIQAWYKVEYLFTVSEHVFNPPPKVKSAVIRMTRNDTQELGCDEKLFKQVVKTTFNQRRKTLRNSIKPILGKECPLTEDTLFNKRPEQLSVEEFIDLTNKVEIALKEMNLQP